MERKCSQCGSWNKDEDHCTQCGAPLSLQKIEEKRMEKHKEQDRFRTPNRFDLFLERLSTNKNPFIRVAYLVLYSVWAILMTLVAGILYMVAGTPG